MRYQKLKYHILFVFLLFLLPFALYAQTRDELFRQYINQYKELAMSHQKQFRIPASITLAQGLFESGAGRGELASKSNNHFGIKCYNGWTGPRVYHDDDIKDDCFRKYDQVSDSYRDHSLFLTSGVRYSNLFSLDIRDYRGWARGLQSAGYATDQSYANKLIKVIEDFRLYEYDDLAMVRVAIQAQEPVFTQKTATPRSRKKQTSHQPYISNGLLYVNARKGDTYYSIAREMGFTLTSLLRYNEVPKDFPLMDGDIVYLQKKYRKMMGKETIHRIQPGESMHSISQIYGIRLKTLYKLNKLKKDYIPNDGDTLRLK